MPDFHIGSFDGSTWTDSERVLVEETDIVASPIRFGLAESKGSLVLASDDDNDAPAGLLMQVPGTDLTVAYTQLDSGVTVAVREKGGGLTAA